MYYRPVFTKTFISTFLLFLGFALTGQEFFKNGSAVQTNDSCFRLTTEKIFDVGSIWFPEKIDLRNNFDLVMTMFFGCANLDGADGIVFGLQPISAGIGEAGEGLGIGGVNPALAVEFDTYQNTNRNDPAFDHVAIMRDGAVTHSGGDNLAGPVRADAGSDNIESCRFYPLRVTWEAASETLKVYFNCELRLEYSGDVIDGIFGGDPFVFYGFAAATGGLFNRQEVCFTFNSFEKQLEDVTMCPGGNVLLDVTGGVSYEWQPAAGLDDPTAASVLASPDTTTVYTVRIFDDCGLPLLDTVRIAVEGDSAFVKLGPDTIVCPGDVIELDVTTPTAIYEWANPALSGPFVTAAEPGTYEVTVTRQDIICEASDRLVIEHFDVPDFSFSVPDSALCPRDSLILPLVFPDAQAFNDGGTAIDTLIVDRPGTYGVEVVHPCITTYDALTVSYVSCREYYVPSAFSPNGDGRNDRLHVYHGIDILNVYYFAVYDRWGEEVFYIENPEPNNADFGWDGTLNGEDALPGNYIWTMEADFRDGSRTVERGSATLIR